MRSMSEIVNLVVDGKLTTQREARAIVDEQAQNLAAIEQLTVDEAREEFRRDLALAAILCTPSQRDRLREIFELKEPR